MTTNKDWEDYINEGYEKCDEQEYNMRELGLNNYGDDCYYFTHKEEFEKDLKIAELEEENLRLKDQLKNAIVPKFNVGQKVYYIDNYKIYSFVVSKIKNRYYDDKDWKYYEFELFYTKEEAEAKLKELKG